MCETARCGSCPRENMCVCGGSDGGVAWRCRFVGSLITQQTVRRNGCAQVNHLSSKIEMDAHSRNTKSEKLGRCTELPLNPKAI